MTSSGEGRRFIMKKFEQLNLAQRAQLQILLKEKKSLQEVSEVLGFSRQTLYREILRNSYWVNNDTIGNKHSCVHYDECRKKLVNKSSKSIVCHPNCIRYEASKRECIKKYPFVCNHCRKKAFCKFLHRFYDPEYASKEYHSRLKETRANPRKEKDLIKAMNKLVSPLVKKGQSIEAILMNHPEIEVSSLTIRDWVRKGYLDCKLSDFRLNGRRISKRYNYSSNRDHVALAEAKIGHKYINYIAYKKDNPNCFTIQFDSVIGNIDGKHSLLTIHIVEHKLQFGILLDSKEKEEVYKRLKFIIDKMKDLLNKDGLTIYNHFTECWLTDNGTEFDNILKLIDDNPDMHIFFCHPNASYEKGSCEKNHEFIRYVHYKGWSFDSLEQKDMDLLFSHINSYPRKSLNKKTPYQSVLEDHRFGKEFLDLININKVNGDDVTLNPSLLRKIKK